MKYKIFIVVVMLLCTLFIIGCDDSSDKHADITPLAWHPIQTDKDCWKCHTPWNETETGAKCEEVLDHFDTGKFPSNSCGLLPSEFAGKGGYECTKSLCTSLGGKCLFVVDGMKGGLCLVNPENIKVRVDYIPEINYTCDSSSSCSVNLKKDNDVINGVEITGLLEPFTSVNMTFNTTDILKNQGFPSSCAYTTDSQMNPDDVTNNDYFPGEEGLDYITHHLFIPSPSTKPDKDEKHQIFIVCKDSSQNSPSDYFSVEFTVAKQPDESAPVILEVRPENHAFKFNSSEAEVELIVDDMSGVKMCKYSEKSPDAKYEEMSDMQKFSCNRIFGSARYDCGGMISNITDKEKMFYFRCMDVNDQVNDEAAATSYSAFYSPQLLIDAMKCPHYEGDECSGELSDGVINMTLYVSGGFGKSICLFELNKGGFIVFNSTNNSDGTSSQPGIELREGENKFDFKCKDEVGNVAVNSTLINFKRDETPPSITKLYSDPSLLYIVTDEKAECRYAENDSVLYDNMTVIESGDKMMHPISYESQPNMVVECRDRFQNSNGKINVKVIKKS